MGQYEKKQKQQSIAVQYAEWEPQILALPIMSAILIVAQNFRHPSDLAHAAT
jgi:hypothetical protein